MQHHRISAAWRRAGSLILVGIVSAALQAANPADEPVRGPFWSGTVTLGKDRPAAMKGLAITLGADRKSHILYDLDTLRVAAAWSGEFLEFGNTLTKIEWPPPPSVKAPILFGVGNSPGWLGPKSESVDPRDKGQGPLPKTWAHHEGVFVHGDRVVLKYSVGSAVVLEAPGVEVVDGQTVFTRTFEFEKAGSSLAVVLAEGVEGSPFKSSLEGAEGPVAVTLSGGRSLSVAGQDLPKGTTLESSADGRLVLTLGKARTKKAYRVALAASASPGAFVALRAIAPVRPSEWTKGGPARWTTPITTQGKQGTEDGPYVVDAITEPFPNVYNTRTFWGGFDFLPDGRAAICAFHGDVWIVSGLDGSLGELKWKRYATGLFQPLGLKVVKGDIYVAGRDQITRLKDLNRDGEADFYENFNNDTVVTPNYHEFVLDLHTDSKGNFYYAKGAPWEPSVTSPHQGTILKVSPDGKKMEVFATGLRAPNGMTVGPDDTVLVGDNQGHWMPSSKLNLVKQGSFMGMVPAAQRELTLKYPDGREIRVNPSDPEARKANGLKGWDGSMPIPTSYDTPICWLPMRWDNSSGGQVYVTSDKWGPWKGAPLFMSYGKCLLYGVLMDEVDGVVQASMVPFNLKFQSGVMRGRFSPKDGQLYVCGLKGWQNAATRDGGFYRVRYTGKPVNMPVKAHVARNGIRLTFSSPVDPATAQDVDGYAVELWNYRYSGGYGSDELSARTPGQKGHDKLTVTAAKVAADGKSVFLVVDGLQPADQYSVKYTLKTATGTELRSEVIGTIRKLGSDVTAGR
jgi:hypothetical protein